VETQRLQELAASSGGELVHGAPATLVRRVTSDSRQVRPGDLFVALRGPHHDGHSYVREAAGRGAAGVLVEAARWSGPWPGCGVVMVADSRRALGQMAAVYRQGFALPLIVVAGSNGKTTTKGLLASVFSQGGETLASEASFNNEIGVPLTLLRLERRHRAAILEAGTNHPGELPALLGQIRPTHGVLTSIGREHLEFFGDLDGVLAEEGSVAACLPAEGVLCVNGDAAGIAQVIARTRAAVLRVGWQGGNDWQVRSAQIDDGGTTFTVRAPLSAWTGDYRIRLLGRHQAVNAALALAMSAALGLSRSLVESGLEACRPAAGRLQLWDFAGLRVLDDAYNANPESMSAALATARELDCAGRRIAVLGDMAEQGDQSAALHAEAAQEAAANGIQSLFAVGQWAAVYGQAARTAGVGLVREFRRGADAAEAVSGFARTGDLVLVKASRAARLEVVVEALRERGPAGELDDRAVRDKLAGGSLARAGFV
jgi:UDP-N-acetylmuramoyl-tripeptide--D-alanyl-D-alanine ligase